HTYTEQFAKMLRLSTMLIRGLCKQRDRFLRSCFSAFHVICVYSHFSAGAASPFQHSKKQTPCWARGRAAHSPSHLHLPLPPTRERGARPRASREGRLGSP
uniref:Uncharacterized protein n=1 Tax=Anas zonorhyncha TaxID=75864 RepID=A0A8B9UDJ4_9AVES